MVLVHLARVLGGFRETGHLVYPSLDLCRPLEVSGCGLWGGWRGIHLCCVIGPGGGINRFIP